MISSTTCSSITGIPGPNASPVTERRPSIVWRAVKNGKSVPNSSLCVDAVLDRGDERLVEQPAARDERRDVGVDVRVAADHRDRLVEPRMAHVRDHDAELRVPQRDLVEQDRPRLEERARARERRALVDQHRQLEPLERLADAEELGPSGSTSW